MNEENEQPRIIRLEETILSHILKTLEEDYPTLFKETEMRR